MTKDSFCDGEGKVLMGRCTTAAEVTCLRPPRPCPSVLANVPSCVSIFQKQRTSSHGISAQASLPPSLLASILGHDANTDDRDNSHNAVFPLKR